MNRRLLDVPSGPGVEPRTAQSWGSPRPEGLAPRIADGLPVTSPVRAGAVVALAGWALLASAMITVGLVLTHVIRLDPAIRWDSSASEWLARHRTDELNAVTHYLTLLANTEGIVLVALIAVVGLGAKRQWSHVWVIVVGLLIELSAFLVTTFTVARSRPDVPRLNSTPATFSYPSGHTAATVVLYGAFAMIIVRQSRHRPVASIVFPLAVVVAVAVAFGRVYRGMHHVSDVAAGGLLGLGSLAIAFLVVDIVDRRRAASSRGEHTRERQVR